MRHRLPSLPVVLLFAALAGRSAVAQHQEVALTSTGVHRSPDHVRLTGPGYTARADGRGFEYVPLLGERAPRAFPLRATPVAVTRGDRLVWTRPAAAGPDAAASRIDGSTVTFAHAGGFTEVYEARAGGVEQSFVLAARPAGEGDLVVRLAIATELPLVAADPHAGLRYEQEGLGGVTIGAVTGVDADGVKSPGTIRVAGDHVDHVEYVLPAAFVDGARYPLVVDPMIGSAFSVGNAPGGDDFNPSVAFDDSTNRYFVVWNVTVASGMPEMRGQFVTAGGTTIGNVLILGNGYLTRQAVANINGTDRFLVAYSTRVQTFPPFGPYSSSVFLFAVDAGNGALSNPVFMESAPVSVSGPFADGAVVGGDSRAVSTAQTALVVFRGVVSAVPIQHHRVRGRIVHVPPTGDPILTGASANDLLNSGALPSITSHGGPSLRWLVTYTVAGTPQSVHGMVVGSAGTPCSADTTLATGAVGDDLANPVNASPDGSQFFVAWSDDNGGAVDVEAMLATWSGSCGTGTLTPGPIVSPPTTVGLQDLPVAAFAKTKDVLAWRNRASAAATSRVYVKGLDPQTCGSCGPEASVENTILGLEDPAIASRWTSGDTASDETLVTWSNTTIRARRFEANGDDVVTAMGGGCSISGFDDYATYNGDAVIGNPNFQLAIANSVSLPLILIVGFGNLSAPCGSCTIVPTLDILLSGNNPYPLPIPCDPLLVDVELYTQWVLLKPSDCPLVPDFAFSNALRFKIGE